MKTRVQLDLYLEDLTKAEKDALKSLKSKSVDFGDTKSTATTHLCGHDEGKKCQSKEDL